MVTPEDRIRHHPFLDENIYYIKMVDSLTDNALIVIATEIRESTYSGSEACALLVKLMTLGGPHPFLNQSFVLGLLLDELYRREIISAHEYSIFK